MTEGIGFGKNSAGLHITQKTGISPEIRGFNVNTAGKDDTCLGDKISEMKNYGIFFDIFFFNLNQIGVVIYKILNANDIN